MGVVSCCVVRSGVGELSYEHHHSPVESEWITVGYRREPDFSRGQRT